MQVYDINPQRMELAERFGAKACSVRDLEKDRDIIVEASGAAEALALSERLVRNGGTLGLYSWHIPTRTVDTSRWHMAGYMVLNTSPLASRNFLADFRAGVTLMGKGVFDLEPLISHEYPFTEAPQVLELLSKNRPLDYIKGVLIFGD